MAHADDANGWFRLFLHGHDIVLLSEKARMKRGTSLLASKGKAESLSLPGIAYIPSGAGPPMGTASRMMRSISCSVACER
jgi:hypothetical protein